MCDAQLACLRSSSSTSSTVVTVSDQCAPLKVVTQTLAQQPRTIIRTCLRLQRGHTHSRGRSSGRQNGELNEGGLQALSEVSLQIAQRQPLRSHSTHSTCLKSYSRGRVSASLSVGSVHEVSRLKETANFHHLHTAQMVLDKMIPRKEESRKAMTHTNAKNTRICDFVADSRHFQREPHLHYCSCWYTNWTDLSHDSQDRHGHNDFFQNVQMFDSEGTKEVVVCKLLHGQLHD